jgi:hypothetical protein
MLVAFRLAGLSALGAHYAGQRAQCGADANGLCGVSRRRWRGFLRAWLARLAEADRRSGRGARPVSRRCDRALAWLRHRPRLKSDDAPGEVRSGPWGQSRRWSLCAPPREPSLFAGRATGATDVNRGERACSNEAIIVAADRE